MASLKQLFPTFLFLTTVLFVSCDSGDDGPDPGDIDLQIENYIAENNLTVSQTASGLYYVIEDAGSDPKIGTNDFVDFDLAGELTNGTSLGSTFNDESSLVLDLTANIIPGLEEGLQLFGTGGKGTLIIHPDLAFGSDGSGNIPGNAVLVYEIEILGTYENSIEYNDVLLSEYISANNLVAEKTASGLYVVIEEMGSDTMPTASQTVSVHYHGYFLNGEVFDSSIDRGTPAEFSLTAVIAGWTEGIPYFGEGGKGKLLIPSHLAYGPQGNSSIPGYTPIAFDVELLEIVF